MFDGSSENPQINDYFQKLEAPPTPNDRQQNKLIAVLLRDNPHFFKPTEVSLFPGEKERFLKDVTMGQINPDIVRKKITSIRPTYKDYEISQLYMALRDYANFRQIKACIAVAITEDRYNMNAFSNRDLMNAHDLYRLTTMYTDPISLENKLQDLIDRIKLTNGEQKGDEYRKSLRVLMRILYGKQQEYWEQFQLLSQDSKNVGGESESKSTVTSIIQNEGSIKKINADKREGMSPAEIRENDEKDANRIVPILQMMVSIHKIPLIFESGDTIHLLSIKERPNISDVDAEKVIKALGAEIRSVIPNINTGDLKRKVLAVFQPATHAKNKDLESSAAFDTKNSIYRVIVSHVNDMSYFENL